MPKVKEYDVWLYFTGAGWWLEEEASDWEAAVKVASDCKRIAGAVAFAITPTGEPLGLFNKRFEPKQSR